MAEDWDRMVRRSEDCCAGCGSALESGSEFVAALCLSEEGLQRQDRCPTCFEQLEEKPFSFWRIRRPDLVRKGPRKLDLAYLTDVFKSLEDSNEEHARRVTWIVGLLLLRKRILKLEGREHREAGEVLRLRLRREDRVVRLEDPGLTPEAIGSLHEDLARIFNLDQDAPDEAADGEGHP